MNGMERRKLEQELNFPLQSFFNTIFGYASKFYEKPWKKTELRLIYS